MKQDTKLADADRELNEHFTAAVGAKAQRYERSGGTSDVSLEELVCSPWLAKAMSKWSAIEVVLAALPAPTRAVLVAVYGRGSGALAEESERATGLIEARDGKADKLGLLRVALVHRRGFGSFLRLAVQQDRALRAFAKRYPSRSPTSDAVLDFLAAEAGRGDASADMLRGLRDECEEQRTAALREFTAIYSVHLERAGVARAAAKDEERRRDERLHWESVTRLRARPRLLPPALLFTDEERERIRARALELLADATEVAS